MGNTSFMRGTIQFEYRKKYHPFILDEKSFDNETQFEQRVNNMTINWLCKLSDKNFYSLIQEILEDSKCSEFFQRNEIISRLRIMKLKQLMKIK